MQDPARIRHLLFLATLFAVACGPADQTIAPDLARKPGGVRSVIVAPSSAALLPGQTVQLTATVKPPSTGAVVAWSSSNSSVAAVSSSGLVTAVGSGTASVSATAGGKSGSAAIVVSEPPPPGDVVFVGAGDIASCDTPDDEATAALINGIAGSVFTLGDNVYPNGTTAEYDACYHPSWGAFKDRTFPSAGNHEYNTPGATGYYQYFGAIAGASGYYSFDLGAWHIIVLNSNIGMSAGSTQEQWLRADLAAHSSAACTLAYWHHPRFSSGAVHGNNPATEPLWQALYDFNADVVLGGHDHTYERFAPQTPGGVLDLSRGIREFVVGTGGRGHYALGTLKANSQVFDGTTFGVLKLTLSPGSYAWQFVPVPGGSFSDSGSAACH